MGFLEAFKLNFGHGRSFLSGLFFWLIQASYGYPSIAKTELKTDDRAPMDEIGGQNPQQDQSLLACCGPIADGELCRSCRH
jgi:hypothetical protein